MSNKRKVGRDEFYAFLESYPRKLEVDVCGISEPAVISYNDFQIAPAWPESIVAAHTPGNDRGAQATYWIYER